MSNPSNVPATAMSYEQLMEENARLKANQNKPKKDTTKLGSGLSCAVSDKGAISIYGLGRFPVTLYRSQLEAIVSVIPQLQAFIGTHASGLKAKAVK